jgi:hypothetical protein
MKIRLGYFKKTALAAAIAATTAFLPISPSHAADHGDGPLASVNRSADLGDLYAFLDPNDNTQLVLALTVQGFIVPSEAENFSVFNDQIQFRIDLETTGDAAPDTSIKVDFTRRRKSAETPQIASITLPNGKKFNALTTPSSFGDTSPTPVIKTDNASGVQFFAGEVDDPFFFDIVGFNRFVASALSKTPNLAELERGRDSFAGYNTLGIALRIPLSLIGTVKDNALGVSAVSYNKATQQQLDRIGNPAVNVALVPFPFKDAYNQANTQRDAAGAFAKSIVGTLKALGATDETIGTLAGIAVSKGDMLRLNLATANSGTQGGNNAGAGFPNGRRLGDDVIDTFFAVLTSGGISEGDHAGPNEKPLRDAFPFFAETHQPLPTGAIDDLTRN